MPEQQPVTADTRMESPPPRAPSVHVGWQQEFARCLAELSALGIADAHECGRLREKLAAGVFTLVAVGQFKRGKSSLINALLGQSLLPVGVVPLTSIVTVLRYGQKPAASVQLESGEIRTVAVDSIAEYVTEKGNPGNVKAVRMAFIDYPSPWLQGGIQIVDTPGIDSVFQHNTDVTNAYLPQADAVLFVASVDQPLSRQELDFLTQIRRYAGKVFCLLNKSDYLDRSELRESVEFSTRALHQALGETVPVHAVSAKLALAGKLAADPEALERSGLYPLEQILREFLDREKSEAWRHSLGHSLLRVLSDAHLKTRMELQAMVGPLEQSEAALQYIAQKKREILTQGSEYEILLSSDVNQLLARDIEPALKQFKEDLKISLPKDLEQWYAALRTLRPKRLEDELDNRIVGRIRDAYDTWRSAKDSEWNAQFENLCRKYWSRIQANVDDLLRHASALLSIPHQAINAEMLWQAESDLYYKFWDEPPSLLLLKSALVRLLPGFLGQPLILRQSKQRAVELVETQAGRLRHDFSERLLGNQQRFAALLHARVESVLGEIETAIRNGIEMARNSKPLADARRMKLSDLEQRIARIRSRVQTVMAAATDTDR